MISPFLSTHNLGITHPCSNGSTVLLRNGGELLATAYPGSERDKRLFQYTVIKSMHNKPYQCARNSFCKYVVGLFLRSGMRGKRH